MDGDKANKEARFTFEEGVVGDDKAKVVNLLGYCRAVATLLLKAFAKRLKDHDL
jgi:hypothetical protein